VLRPSVSPLVCHPDYQAGCEILPYEFKAGPAGGRLRRPSSRRQRHDGYRGTGLTLHPRGNHTVGAQRRDGADGVWAGGQPSGRELPSRAVRYRNP
jgi:hypothetical protein